MGASLPSALPPSSPPSPPSPRRCAWEAPRAGEVKRAARPSVSRAALAAALHALPAIDQGSGGCAPSAPKLGRCRRVPRSAGSLPLPSPDLLGSCRPGPGEHFRPWIPHQPPPPPPPCLTARTLAFKGGCSSPQQSSGSSGGSWDEGGEEAPRRGLKRARERGGRARACPIEGGRGRPGSCFAFGEGSAAKSRQGKAKQGERAGAPSLPSSPPHLASDEGEDAGCRRAT